MMMGWGDTVLSNLGPACCGADWELTGTKTGCDEPRTLTWGDCLAEFTWTWPVFWGDVSGVSCWNGTFGWLRWPPAPKQQANKMKCTAQGTDYYKHRLPQETSFAFGTWKSTLIHCGKSQILGQLYLFSRVYKAKPFISHQFPVTLT